MAVRDDFTAGEVLAAADLNDTFASKVPFAYGTATPTTTVEGFIWFDEATTPPTAKVWDGSAFENIAAPVTEPGLVHINTTTFTAQSTVSLNNVFTSLYANYKIIVTLSSSGAGAINLRLRKSGTDDSTANYDFQYTSFNNTALIGARNTGQTAYSPMTNAGFAQPHMQTLIEISNPQVNDRTTFQNVANFRVSAGSLNAVSSGYHNVVDQFDGFTLYPDSPTTITGTIRVYGYKNS
jgi:hypothetical protein